MYKKQKIRKLIFATNIIGLTILILSSISIWILVYRILPQETKLYNELREFSEFNFKINMAFDKCRLYANKSCLFKLNGNKKESVRYNDNFKNEWKFNIEENFKNITISNNDDEYSVIILEYFYKIKEKMYIYYDYFTDMNVPLGDSVSEDCLMELESIGELISNDLSQNFYSLLNKITNDRISNISDIHLIFNIYGGLVIILCIYISYWTIKIGDYIECVLKDIIVKFKSKIKPLMETRKTLDVLLANLRYRDEHPDYNKMMNDNSLELIIDDIGTNESYIRGKLSLFIEKTKSFLDNLNVLTGKIANVTSHINNIKIVFDQYDVELLTIDKIKYDVESLCNETMGLSYAISNILSDKIMVSHASLELIQLVEDTFTKTNLKLIEIIRYLNPIKKGNDIKHEDFVDQMKKMEVDIHELIDHMNNLLDHPLR